MTRTDLTDFYRIDSRDSSKRGYTLGLLSSVVDAEGVCGVDVYTMSEFILTRDFTITVDV